MLHADEVSLGVLGVLKHIGLSSDFGWLVLCCFAVSADFDGIVSCSRIHGFSATVPNMIE